jgi:uncharacterized protein (DUF305 family)
VIPAAAALQKPTAALLAAAGATACAAPAAVGGPAGQPITQLPPAPREGHPADVEFMTGMIHHHAQALVMARLAEPNGANPQIRTLSERITVSQDDEIRSMQQWLGEMGAPVPEPNPRGMPMTMAGMEHDMLMPGMLSEAQMAELEAARGVQFDRLFLRYMIQHHEGALQMVEKLFVTHGGGVDDFIYKVASDTFADQGSEIDRMQRMLDALGG